ncbi:MAG: flavodoxin family protein [Anaerolineae bacterium]
MKTLVIYDSFYGNTEQIAQAIGRGLGPPEEVEVRRVGDVQPAHLTGLNWLVVGSPTRGFRPSPAVTNFLKGLPADGLRKVKVAAFDTRVDVRQVNSPILTFMVRLFGYAAKPIADRLTKKGGQLALPPEGFIVEGTEGPLREGELERATDWARQLLAAR